MNAALYNLSGPDARTTLVNTACRFLEIRVLYRETVLHMQKIFRSATEKAHSVATAVGRKLVGLGQHRGGQGQSTPPTEGRLPARNKSACARTKNTGFTLVKQKSDQTTGRTHSHRGGFHMPSRGRTGATKLSEHHKET